MKFPVRIPFVEALGVELRLCEGGFARVALSLRHEHLNSFHVAHGGVTMTLLDVAMAHAARSPGQPGHPTSQGVVTLEMKTTFMRPARGCLVATARVLHRTATLAFCEAWIEEDEANDTAEATEAAAAHGDAAASDDAATARVRSHHAGPSTHVGLGMTSAARRVAHATGTFKYVRALAAGARARAAPDTPLASD